MMSFLFSVFCATTVFTANAAPYNEADPNVAFKSQSSELGEAIEAELNSKPPTPSPIVGGSHCEEETSTVAWESPADIKTPAGHSHKRKTPAEKGNSTR